MKTIQLEERACDLVEVFIEITAQIHDTKDLKKFRQEYEKLHRKAQSFDSFLNHFYENLHGSGADSVLAKTLYVARHQLSQEANKIWDSFREYLHLPRNWACLIEAPEMLEKYDAAQKRFRILLTNSFENEIPSYD